MPNNFTNISQTVKGMNFDFSPMNLTEGMYAFAQNAVVESIDGMGFPVLQNEGSNTLAVSFPSGSTIVGYVNVVEQNRIIWMLSYPESGMSELGETLNPGKCRNFVVDAQTSCDDCSSLNLSQKPPLETIKQIPCAGYRKIQSDTCFNFSEKYPVNAIIYKILSCGLQIFFSDDNNPRRWLEFQYVNDDPTQGLVILPQFYQIIGFQNPPCDDPIYGPDLDCNALNVQPNINTPCIEFLGETGGGSLIAGVYQFFIAMSDVKGNKLSSFLSATNPIPVRTKDISTITNYPTDRSIQLKIDNLDPLGVFRYYNLAVAKTIDNVTSFYLVGTFPVTQQTYTYTGNNQAEIKLTETDIFTLYPYYTNAGTVAQSNGILYWANINESVKPNLQRVANNIILQWQTIAIPEAVYRDPKNVERFRSYMRDEVYAMGIQFIFDSGEETNAYHIPGRTAIPSDLVVINNDDVIAGNNCSGDTNVLRWQVYNTATIEGGDLSIYNGCDESCYQYGNFSYWESTQVYPNNSVGFDIWGDLCGQTIRHHKFPDSLVTHIHNNENGVVDASGGTFVQNNIVYPIGVKVDHDSVRASIAAAVSGGIITAEDAARIVGYRIVRGNRAGNKSIICKGLLYDVNHYQRIDTSGGSSTPIIDQTPVYFANYPYNDLRVNPFLTTDFKNYEENNVESGPNLPFSFSNRYTFHSPDTHFNQPGLGTELKLETVEYGQAQGFYEKCRKQAKQKLLSEFSYGVALAVGIVEVLVSSVPQATAAYTVKSGSTTITGTVPLMQFADGTSSVAIPSDENLTENTIPGVVQHFDSSTGALEPATTAGSSYTVTSVRGGFTQFSDPNSVDPVDGPTPAVLLPLAIVAQGALGFLTTLAGFLEKILVEMNLILDLIKSLVPFRDWVIQYNSIGRYNNYSTVLNDIGVKRRIITSWSYLDGNNQTINEPVNPITGQFDFIKFNNLNREDSVYIKYGGVAVPDAGTSSGIEDTSRTRVEDFPFSCKLNVDQYTPISSYYASVKNYVADQYGTIYNIEYLRTDSCAFNMTQQNSTCRGVYGGDIFINRFALKIKVPYFLATTFDLPNGTDFDFSSVTNLAFPRNYYNTTPTVGSNINNIADLLNPFTTLLALYNLLGGPNSIRNCEGSTWFDQSGYIYLYHYGIPYFLVESDYNVDYRYGTNNLEGDFYPHQSDLDFWLQEVNVPITEPNTYFYNNTYSKQNKETFIGIDQPDFQPGRTCRITHPNRIIYADGENWLVYKADNFFDYPLSQGRIVSIEGIENQTVLVRTDNNTSIFKSILRIPVDGQTSQIGNGGVFSNPPQDFGTTTLGYIGTQHKAILHTEYGHVWADAKRGQIFNVAAGAGAIDEISKNGMKNWFKENLPFRILRDFQNMPEQDADNATLGIGITMAFDKRFNRFLITKLDWKRIDPLVQYDPVNKNFFKGSTIIELGDKKYFKDCSWTASYNFFTKSWVAFHSYKPNYYIDFIDFFSSGINADNSSYWVHDLYNGSFQVFYGKIYPFIVEPVIKFGQPLRQLNSVEFETEVRRYSNEFDYTVKKQIPGFNKVIVYNDWYNTGLMNLVNVDKDNFSLTGIYPIIGYNNWKIEVTNANYKWRFNQFFALNRDNSEIPMWIYAGNNEEKSLNLSAFNYKKDEFSLARMKGQWFKERFINDSLSNYKIIFKLSIDNQTVQFK